jgi:hypothetical protein
MRQTVISAIAIVLLCTGEIAGQERSASHNEPRIVFDGHISTVHLAQHFTTTIRLPEPVSSVVLGDSSLFQAEHSPNEPLLVFVKPTTTSAETNILISTTGGRQFSLLLNSGDPGQPDRGVDLLVVCRTAGSSFIEENYPTSLIAESLALGVPAQNEENAKPGSPTDDPLSALLERQRKAPLPERQETRLAVGVGQVVQRDLQFVVLFSVVNSTSESVELMSPQVQLAGQVKSGLFGHGSRWTTVDQIPVLDFRLDKRKLGAGARTDGLVVFERPVLKQSNENLLLQIADAAKVDQPVLVPISFSVSAQSKEKP